jgi:alpha-N-arabinofuranosidase
MRCTVPFLSAALLLACLAGNAFAATSSSVALLIQTDQARARIDRNVFGQFAEHPGSGIYDGIWVGKNSRIPNVRGIRSDVVAALRLLRVPNVRWPGGCFADEYHWRDGVGPASMRKATVNSNWSGAAEPNSFGTEEFMDFVDQIGSNAYISLNVGSGTPKEAVDWMAYMTADATTGAGRERSANGHPAPYKVRFVGIGNESRGCGGSMSPTITSASSRSSVTSRVT